MTPTIEISLREAMLAIGSLMETADTLRKDKDLMSTKSANAFESLALKLTEQIKASSTLAERLTIISEFEQEYGA